MRFPRSDDWRGHDAKRAGENRRSRRELKRARRERSRNDELYGEANVRTVSMSVVFFICFLVTVVLVIGLVVAIAAFYIGFIEYGDKG